VQFNFTTETVTGKFDMTSSEPSGLKWFFEGYDYDYYDYGVQLSKLGTLKSSSKSSSKLIPLLDKSKELKFFR
jgi:hypothetical protein